jgi:hypothetical protein
VSPTSAELLDKYRPRLVYDSRELYGAGAVEMMTDNVFTRGPCASYGNALRRADETVIAVAGADPALEIGFLRDGSYPNGADVAQGDYLDAANLTYPADARQWRVRPGFGSRVYGRDVARSGTGRRWLQYWFFYYFNAKQFARLGLHEGDWEMIQIGLDAADAPEVATYSQHAHGEKADWAAVETTPGGAPIVYVARDSHSSLFRSGSHPAPIVDDVCDGGGKRERPPLAIITASSPAWVKWPGRWGASRSGQFQSPLGPAFHSQWRDPDKFDRDAEPLPPRAVAPGAIEPDAALTPEVRVNVTGEGARRRIDYAVIRPPGVSFAAELTIVVNAPGDAEPQRFVFDATNPGAKQPLPPP